MKGLCFELGRVQTQRYQSKPMSSEHDERYTHVDRQSATKHLYKEYFETSLQIQEHGPLGRKSSTIPICTFWSIETWTCKGMATKSDQRNTGQESLNDNSSQVVAVYRFVVIDGKAFIGDNPEQGIWVSKKGCAYTAHVARIGWKASF